MAALTTWLPFSAMMGRSKVIACSVEPRAITWSNSPLPEDVHRRVRSVPILARMLSAHRGLSRKGRRTLAMARAFTLFETRSINFSIVVYATVCMSMLDLR
jgi:hypothetical protein